MIIKPIYLSSSLYRCISTHIKETEHLYVRFGIKNGAFLRDICPYKRSIKYFSSTPLRLNSEGETESKQTLNPTMDILKNAMSKAVILNTFENRNLIKQETVIPSISPTLNSEAKIKTTDGVQNKPLMNPDTIIDHIQYGPVQKETTLLSPVQFHSSNNPKNGNFKGEEPPKSKDTAKAVKKKVRVDLSVASMERNFITPARAISDFLLKPQDMESLKATKRRSPYENEPPITVYWRKDVEAKAIEVWGTKENLQKELFKRDLERKFHQQNLFANKRRLRDYRRVRNSQNDIAFSKTSGLFGSSGKVVLTAVAINGSNFVFKLAAWLYSGSHSMFSECIHSLADTINQLILAFGIHKSVQIADEIHPYGYSNMKYVSSLISGVGIFCVGTGLSIYHGITGLYNPAPAESYFWAFCILGGSLVSEGATLMVAINSIKKGAIAKGMTFMEYVLRGQEPSVNVVLLEDLAAVLGVTVAASCMGLTCVTGSHVPDAVGSIIIGGLLGAVASFIIYTNVAALVGRSISEEFLEKINTELESDVMIRAIHDVKGIDMGNCLVRYKAELDFDGRELAKAYLDSQNIHALLDEVQKFKTIDELEQFILKHSENIIDMMGGEIDRIEVKLRAKFPEIRHCDLEIL